MNKKASVAEDYMKKKLRPAEETVKSPAQKMIINTSSVDENGKSIKQHVGTFHVLNTDLYSETIKIRPLAVYNKLIKMIKGKDSEGKEKWNYVNQTVFFNNYGETLYDAKGGLACGKVFGEERARLSKEAAEANNDKAKSYLYLFGLVQFPGSKEWQLVDLRVGGKRIMEISKAVSTATIGKGHFMSQFIFDLTCTSKAGTVHPDVTMTIDQKAGEQDVSNIIEYDNDIANYIESNNEYIMRMFNKYSTQAANITDDELMDELDLKDIE